MSHHHKRMQPYPGQSMYGDDNSESDDDHSQNDDLFRNNSRKSNTSMGPPAPRKAGWVDRLSGASVNDAEDEEELVGEGKNGSDSSRGAVKDAWGKTKKFMKIDVKSKSAKKSKKASKSSPTTDGREEGAENETDHTASAAEVQQPTKYKKVYDKYWNNFSNMGYADDEEDEQEAAAIEQIFLGIINNIKTSEETLQEWKIQRQRIKENTQDMHDQIEARKKELQEMVDKYAHDLHDKVDNLSESRLDLATSSISGLKDTMKDMQKVAEKNFKEEKIKMRGLKMTRNKLEKLCAKFDHLNVEPPTWQPITLEHVDQSPQLVGAFFGALKGGVSASLKTGMLDNDEHRTNIGSIMPLPELKESFQCKTSKDSRECGVTDVVVTSSNDIVVVDKHNKLVKVFDTKGSFKCFIGRKMLKEPSRVSILSANDHVLITDMSCKSIKIFHPEGKYIGEFASDLKYPICHCEMYDGNVAVLEYATKCVIIYEPSLKQLHSFDTFLNCPAYIACTKNNHLVVTDWRNNIMRIFDPTGTEIVSITGPSENDSSINAPQGVCADRFGNILVAEKGTRQVKVFTEDGLFVQTFSHEENNFKIPWALACNKYDLLVVGEYQGNIKLLKYLDLPFNTIMSEDYQRSKMKHKKRSVGLSNQVSIEDATKC